MYQEQRIKYARLTLAFDFGTIAAHVPLLIKSATFLAPDILSYELQPASCGTCETQVLEGVPDHRDLILTREEQEANRSMMICCSGSRSQRLVLDL